MSLIEFLVLIGTIAILVAIVIVTRGERTPRRRARGDSDPVMPVMPVWPVDTSGPYVPMADQTHRASPGDSYHRDLHHESHSDGAGYQGQSMEDYSSPAADMGGGYQGGDSGSFDSGSSSSPSSDSSSC